MHGARGIAVFACTALGAVILILTIAAFVPATPDPNNTDEKRLIAADMVRARSYKCDEPELLRPGITNGLVLRCINRGDDNVWYNFNWNAARGFWEIQPK